jgi:hypothetical protein
MKILKSTEMIHPILLDCMRRIQRNVIDAHNMPIRLFETGREHDRHALLINKGKTKDLLSRHLFNLENDPPLYCSALDYVHYNGKWSWNLRDSSIQSWYTLFGNLVLDECPELEWSGFNRKATNYCHFQLRCAILIENLDKFPCVTP